MVRVDVRAQLALLLELEELVQRRRGHLLGLQRSVDLEHAVDPGVHLVARNAIPHRRLGKQIRFSRAAIMRWLDPWSSQGAKEGH